MNTLDSSAPQAAPTAASSRSGPGCGLWHIETLDILRERLRSWPAVFPRQLGDPVVPLAVDVENQLVRLLAFRDIDAIMLIKVTMRRYCRSSQYLAALARDGEFHHDLDGNPVEPVSPADKSAALAALEESRRLAIRFAPPKTTEQIMVTVKALKITAVLSPEQLTPTEASTVMLTLATPDGAKATAKITGKAYRRALNQIVALGGGDQVVVVLQGSIKKPGEIEGAGISVQVRKPPAAASESEGGPEPGPG